MGFIGRFGTFTSGAGLFSLSGIVQDNTPAPISGVVVDGGVLGQVTTGADGTFLFSNLSPGTAYSLTASKANFSFNGPLTGTLNSNVSGLTFNGTDTATWSISGTVKNQAAAAVAGATVSCPGLSNVTSDGSGNYTFSNVADNFAYSITAAKTGYTSGAAVTGTLTANVTGKNPTMTIQTFTISGQVTDNTATALSGVTLTEGTLGTKTSDGSGNFSYTSVPYGTVYSIAATKTGYGFNGPMTGTVTGNVTLTTFVGSQYNPSNYFTGGTAVAWWAPWDNTMLDASGTLITSGTTLVKTIPDKTGNAHNLVQSSSAHQAAYNAAALNGYPTLKYAAHDTTGYVPATFTAQFNSASSICFFAVMKPVSVSGNSFIATCFDNSFSFRRFHAYISGYQQSLAWNVVDGADQSNLVNAAAGMSDSVWHAVLWILDCANGRCYMYYDNAVVPAANPYTHGSAQNMPNTALNQPQLFQMEGEFVDAWFWKNAIPNSTQISQLFADVKAKFSLSAY